MNKTEREAVARLVAAARMVMRAYELDDFVPARPDLFQPIRNVMTELRDAAAEAADETSKGKRRP